jgi:hypothetical protein
MSEASACGLNAPGHVRPHVVRRVVQPQAHCRVGVYPTRVSGSPALGYRRAMFSAAKDLMTSKAAKSYANNLIASYGQVDELNIDSKRCRIDLVVRLNGEVSPIGVTIERYALESQGGKKFIQVQDSSATRPWLQAVMRDHLHGRRFEVPSWAAAAL